MIGAEMATIASVKRQGTVERAFALARAGAFQTIPELVAVLKREQHEAVEAHLAGRSIRKDLQRLCVAGRAAPTAQGS